jgi:hypothetical protein
MSKVGLEALPVIAMPRKPTVTTVRNTCCGSCSATGKSDNAVAVVGRKKTSMFGLGDDDSRDYEPLRYRKIAPWPIMAV